MDPPERARRARGDPRDEAGTEPPGWRPSVFTASDNGPSWRFRFFPGYSRAVNPIDIYRDDLLRGHVALITGGGTGINKGIAAAYARLGCEVAITSRKQDQLDATALAVVAGGLLERDDPRLASTIRVITDGAKPQGKMASKACRSVVTFRARPW